MEYSPTILLVHSPHTAWGDLIDELRALPLPVQVATSIAEAELCLCNQRPDVVMLDGSFDRGIELLLHARQTATGVLLVTLRKLRSEGGHYDATLAGEQPTYLAPTPARQLARLMKLYLRPVAH
jgi:DNA-binding response OmpR family regulator